MWAFYVNGYKPDTHCQFCFRGRRIGDFSTNTASSARDTVFDRMDRYPYVYVCGVGSGPKTEFWSQNLHLPLKFKEGGIVEVVTYNGYVFHADNAEAVPIPALEDGWMGLDREHTRCKNFQFAVACFGSSANCAVDVHTRADES